MRILCVATKLPWPPRDGGRLALALTLQGLADDGHEIHLVAPVYDDETVPAEPIDRIRIETVALPRLPWTTAAVRAVFRRRALSVVRHHRAELEQAVDQAIIRFRPDVVHAEQLQALANCSPALRRGIPVVLRTQNVESHIWQQVGAASLRHLPLTFEARRLRVEESRALAATTHTLTLTENDAAALRDIGAQSTSAKISALAPPFPPHLPPGKRLEGEPAIALSGSAGWWPNTQATQWFLHEVLPLISRQLPHAVVHVFGGEASVSAQNIRWHSAPADSAEAFPDGAIAAVPLFVGSGIRMRILEACARGLPVVATSIAARGLEVAAGRELAIADTPEAFCAAIRLLAENESLRAAMIDAGRRYLTERHGSVQLTQALLRVYQHAIAQQRAGTP